MTPEERQELQRLVGVEGKGLHQGRQPSGRHFTGGEEGGGGEMINKVNAFFIAAGIAMFFIALIPIPPQEDSILARGLAVFLGSVLLFIGLMVKP